MTVHEPQTDIILEVGGLTINYGLMDGSLDAVRNVSFRLGRGRALGIVGESGCGKSTLARGIFGALPPNGKIVRGRVSLGGQDITSPSPVLERLRWKELSFVPQAAIASLDPLYRVGRQVAEIYEHHQKLNRRTARERAAQMLLALDLPAAAHEMYPHELSGGMRQRVIIASALALHPQILIADEPTTALDTLVQHQVFERFDAVRREIGTSLMLITHDLGLVADHCDDILVMYGGEVVESGLAAGVLFNPAHAYTRQLLNATRRLGPSARVRGLDDLPHRQSTLATRTAQKRVAPAPSDVPSFSAQVSDTPLVEFDRVVRIFRRKFGFFRRGRTEIRAVDGVSFAVSRGEVLGIIGASGSGKSTIANLAIGLDRPTSGSIRHEDESRAGGGAPSRSVQLIFQDPYQSMNPIYRVDWIVAEPLRAGHKGKRLPRAEIRRRVSGALEAAGLCPAENYLTSRLHQLSGGQRQRVAIARAIVTEPHLILADEPVSMLDVSVRAGVLETLRELASRGDRAMIYITHDLGTVGFICDRLLVLREGRSVETGPCLGILDAPRADYTRALLNAMPGRKLRQQQRINATS
jgi:peptide/nickel transport system ATP-binding protein